MQDIAEKDRESFPSAEYLIARASIKWGNQVSFPVEGHRNDPIFVLSRLADQVNSPLLSLLPAKLPPQFAPTSQADPFAKVAFSIDLGHFTVACTDYADVPSDHLSEPCKSIPGSSQRSSKLARPERCEPHFRRDNLCPLSR